MSAPTDGRPTVILVAGEAQKGKTKALNNIFGTTFEERTNTNIAVREVRRNGRSYILVDTPGFGSMSIPDKSVKEFISSAIRGLDFTLLFCLHINSGNIGSEVNRKILINLQNCLHDRIWEKCVLLLTHSDDLVRSTGDAEEYKQSIVKHSADFKDLLNSTFKKEYTINTVFDYKDDCSRQNSGFPGIVAVPVRKEPDTKTPNSDDFDRNPDVIPGVPATVSWGEVAMDEINTKIAPLQGELTSKNFKAIVATVGSTLAGGAAGAGAGGGIGVAIGVVGGPIGMAVGAAIGGVAGTITGLFSGLTLGATISYHAWMKVTPDDQIRRLRDQIPR